jgi:hypothetical protein
MTKLTDHQRNVLVDMRRNGDSSLCPGGYSKAGPDASRWTRTMHCLARHNLVVRCGWQSFKLTLLGQHKADDLIREGARLS